MLAGERDRVVVHVGGQRAALHDGQGAAPGPRVSACGESRVQIRRAGQQLGELALRGVAPLEVRGPRAPAERGRAARARRRSRSAPRTMRLPKPRAARGRRACPTGPARSMPQGTTLRPTRRASSHAERAAAPRRSPRRSARSERWTPRGGGAAAPSPGTGDPESSVAAWPPASRRTGATPAARASASTSGRRGWRASRRPTDSAGLSGRHSRNDPSPSCADRLSRAWDTATSSAASVSAWS